jgi:hypothetical protein
MNVVQMDGVFAARDRKDAEQVFGDEMSDSMGSPAGYCPNLRFPLPMECGRPADSERRVPADATLYRDIRLEGLRRNPEAFGSTFEAEDARPLAFFSERLGGSAAFGAFHGSQLVGIAELLIREGKKRLTRACWWACTFALAHGMPGLGGDWSRQ